MSLAKMVNEISAQAEKDAKKIVKEAQHQADLLMDETKQQIKEQQKRFDAETKKLVEEKNKVELSSMRLEQTRRKMNARKELLEEVYAKVREKLSKLDVAQRKIIIKKLADKAMKEISNPKYVYSNTADKGIVSNLPNLTYAGSINVSGGIIVENIDKSIRANYSFDDLLEELKEETIHETTQKIFGKE